MIRIKRFCCVIIMIITLQLGAQELNRLYMTGAVKFLDTEFVGHEIKDSNGEVCAGLLILTDLEGLSFDSNNGSYQDARVEPGRILLYLSPDERKIIVMKKVYKPLELILNDYGISLVSGGVYQIEVTGNKNWI